MADTVIINLDSGVRHILSYAGDIRTFRLATDRIKAAALTPLDPVIEDFLEVACAIFFADSSFKRGGDTRPHMGAGWRRRFHITVPVEALDRWSDPAVVAALTDVASFLTEDEFTFDFVAGPPRQVQQGVLNLDPGGPTFEAEEVILFSGGLNSFAGALEALATSQNKVLLVSHRSAQKVKPRQDRLAKYLRDTYRNRLQHVKVEAHRTGPQARDTTQRSRTLLFAALGHAVAQSFGARCISFYENGVVSHNLPISPQVIGTMATRTTHPLALHLLNQLMALLRPASPPIRNGYEWLTKKEVVQRIAQHGAAHCIRKAVSCTSVREQTTLHPHCGTCSQCLDRRFGILSAGLGHEDPAEGYKTDVLLGPRSGHAARMGIEWTRHAVRLARMTPMDFLSDFGNEINRILAGHPDLAPDHAWQLIASLHQRQGKAVQEVLENAVRDNRAFIVDGSLETTSLLKLHIAASPGATASWLPPDLGVRPRPHAVPDFPEGDCRIDREGPLEVAFYRENEKHVLSVRGLCKIIGVPAEVAHRLKPTFDEDRRLGLSVDEHRYVNDIRTLGWELSNEAYRQHVRRCRRTLAESYEDVFGAAPMAPLLIQNKPRAGYRLDPMTKIVARESL